MRLESTIGDVHDAGAEVIAISVDDEVRQAGMAERWKLAHLQLVADPGGERYLKPLGLFDPEDRGGIALPANLVIAPDGTEAYRYNGRDFADRVIDDEVTNALGGLGLGPVDPGPISTSILVPEDLRGYFQTATFGPYFAGNKFAAIAISSRLPSKETAAVARDHRLMAESSIEAWTQLNS